MVMGQSCCGFFSSGYEVIYDSDLNESTGSYRPPLLGYWAKGLKTNPTQQVILPVYDSDESLQQ